MNLQSGAGSCSLSKNRPQDSASQGLRWNQISTPHRPVICRKREGGEAGQSRTLDAVTLPAPDDSVH